jgi:hypothetical protein
VTVGPGPLLDGIDPQRPSAARVYDFLLGGTHNFASDRAAAAAALQAYPQGTAVARSNRAFMRRAVIATANAGVDQYLDLGSGIPTVGNVHDIARTVHPQARVVYVDFDPIAVLHSRSILGDDPHSAVLQADLTVPDSILTHPSVCSLLDFTRPVCVLAVAVAHFVADTDALVQALNRYRDAVCPGSYLVVSHFTDEASPQDAERARQVYNRTTFPLVARGRQELRELLDGWELLDPGVTASGDWHPAPDDPHIDELASRSVIVALARKP